MTTVYKFKAYYTDAGVGTAQDPAPVCTVINMADDSKLADAQATTASTNMPGLYSYEYSGADGLDVVAFFATTDTGCDVKQLASYVSEKITTNLNADVAGVETKLDTVDANVDAILADTGTDGVIVASGTVTTLTNLPAAPTNWLTAAAVKADAVTKLQANLALEATLTAIKGAGWDTQTLAAIDVLIDAIKAKTDTITAAPTVDAIADGVWDEAIAAHTTATTFGGKNQKVVPSETINDYKADVSGLATQTSVNAIPTAPLLAANYTAPDNATIGTIAGNVDDLETRLTAARAGYLDKLNVSGTLAHSNDAATYKADVSGLATSTEVSAIALLGETVIGSYTVQDILTILAAKMVGKATGGGTTTIKYRGVDDTTDVVVETVDDNGNRSAVTLTV